MILSTLAYAVRSLRKSPGFTAVAVSVLALGIGCSLAIFAGVNGLMFRRLAVREPNQLVVLGVAGPQPPNQDFPFPLFERTDVNRAFPFSFYELFRDRSQTLADVIAVSGWMEPRPMVASGLGMTAVETVNSEEVSGNYFDALGIAAVRGRTLQISDDSPSHPEPVVVIAYAFWVRRFGADASIVGKTLKLDGVAVTIVGILPPDFRGAQVGVEPDLWYPIQLNSILDGNLPWGAAATKSTLPWINILGRLKPGISREQASAELDILLQGKLEEMDPRRKALRGQQKPANLPEQRILLEGAATGYAGLRSTLQQPLFLLMASVGLMQLIACANVGALLLSRGVARRYEYALRAALGASRGRLIGHMMAESFVLAALAGVTGLALVAVGIRWFAHYVPGIDLQLDWTVASFGLATTFLTAAGFGLVPALRLSRVALTNRLKERSAGGRQRLGTALVIMQIGFAFLLLSAAGLFARTLHNVSKVDTGFQRTDRELFDLNVPNAYSPSRRAALYRKLDQALSEQPEVTAASSYQGLMVLGDVYLADGFSVPGYTPVPGEELQAGIVLAGPSFFQTMGIPLLQGRDFDLKDGSKGSSGKPPIVISAWSAQKLFGAADPIGKEIKLDRVFEVTGIARNIKYAGLKESPSFVFYIPMGERMDAFSMTFAVEMKAGRQLSFAQIADLVQRIDPQAQPIALRTIEDKLEQGMTQERLISHVSGFFGLSALLLSVLGLFGLLSHSVARRTREIGTRMALGASLGRILQLVIKEGVIISLCGCGAGMVGTTALMRFTERFLFGVGSLDTLTLGLAATGVLVVAVIASGLPAWKAAKVQPVVALRSE